MVKCYLNLSIFTVFLKNIKIIFRTRRSKVTDYAALIYRSENYHFSRFWRRSNIFHGGGDPTFSREGGSNCLLPIETNITCDFQGGSGPPVPTDNSMY